MTKAKLIAFEDRIRGLWESGDLPFLVHLSGGNEDQLLAIFNGAGEEGVKEGDWVFSSHRGHYHALLSGVPARRVEKLIREGSSMFVFDREHNFFTSSILAGTVGIAAGVAWQLKQEGSPNRVWCFLGDGAVENGNAFSAALFVDAHELPCRFIIEDSGYQVDTPLVERRCGKPHLTNPLSNFTCVSHYAYTRVYPHAGSGCPKNISFSSEAVVRYLQQRDGARREQPQPAGPVSP